MAKPRKSVPKVHFTIAEKIRKLTEAKTVPITYNGEEHKFVIKPLSARGIADVTLTLDGLKPETVKEELSEAEGFSKVLYPMCEVLFPACCVKPKIVITREEESASEDPKNTICIDDIPPGLMVPLFEKIYENSGLTVPKEEDSIKK